MATTSEKARIFILVEMFSNPNSTIKNNTSIFGYFGYYSDAKTICDTLKEDETMLMISYNKHFTKTKKKFII